ncbi:MAG: DUF3795 domain-containing protein [Thermovirgaceae bacterium]|nr:DUF3795 domain-containing protein [Thermovirgaceae bacterium]
MKREELVTIIAPCGLNCGKCLAFEGGDIRMHAQELRKLLGENFSVYADRFADMNPVFGGYEEFAALLEYLASGLCGGCRKQGCLFQSCLVQHCVRENGVDFCFECEKFPCEEHGFPEGLKKRWEANNRRIRDLGIEGYYAEVKDDPRYP